MFSEVAESSLVLQSSFSFVFFCLVVSDSILSRICALIWLKTRYGKALYRCLARLAKVNWMHGAPLILESVLLLLLVVVVVVTIYYIVYYWILRILTLSAFALFGVLPKIGTSASTS